MTQTPKKRTLPKNISKLTDYEVMERVVGKGAMREIDALVATCSGEQNDEKSSTKEEDTSLNYLQSA